MIELIAGCALFHEGDDGDYFYILKEGLLELTIGATKEKKFLKSGSVFGELALIQKNKRSGTIICVENSTIFCIDGTAFREVTLKVNQLFFKERIYFLSLIPIFNIQLNHFNYISYINNLKYFSNYGVNLINLYI